MQAYDNSNYLWQLVWHLGWHLPVISQIKLMAFFLNYNLSNTTFLSTIPLTICRSGWVVSVFCNKTTKLGTCHFDSRKKVPHRGKERKRERSDVIQDGGVIPLIKSRFISAKVRLLNIWDCCKTQIWKLRSCRTWCTTVYLNNYCMIQIILKLNL